MFIRKLALQVDLDQVKRDLETILTMQSWPEGNQIGFNHRPGAELPWLDSTGNRHAKYKENIRPLESDFSVWNKDVPAYTTEQIELLRQHENCNFGRVRVMRLMPKCGLSVHFDVETRYHLVLKTNASAYFGHVTRHNREDCELPATGVTYHIPADSHWYEVDTRQLHYVYNGGHEERIHIVACKL